MGSYLWLFRGSLRFPQAFILLPCGILVIWLVNAVRITLLVLFGAYVSPEIALGGFHSAPGWIGFLAIALSIVAVSRRISFFAVRQSVGTEAREGDPTAAWLIFRVLGSVIMVPIAEELAFRGYALRRLISSDFDKISPRFTWLSFLRGGGAYFPMADR